MTNSAHIRLIINTEKPIELSDFVGQYIAIGNEFERFLKQYHPNKDHRIKFFINEVNHGSIITDIIAAIAVNPVLPALPMIATQVIDDIMLLEDFIKRWGSRLISLMQKSKPDEIYTSKELESFHETVAIVAKDQKASATIEVATFVDKKRKVFSQFKFNNSEAIAVERNIELIKYERKDKEDNTLHERVLMTFTRSSTSNAKIFKKSEDKVLITDICPTPLSLIYATDMVEKQLKHEIRESDDNIYKKGFVVDVMVKSQNEKPIAYSVIDIHQVIDLE